ncbi:tigger transposable element-derived 6 [Brachionus plicatilis]|uniref:Tigger transposable element-derived 6 n=1 Tax=Brachionus plicatilis TaxID=10195 RepID=A0A3M7S4R8_BRAPC|nr:tigger transposable element-derived 6 [Brachionus plicatilis]
MKTKEIDSEYGVNTSTISTILSSKAKILEPYEKNLCGPEKKRIKLSSYDDVDKSVLFWLEQVQKYICLCFDSNLPARGSLSDIEIINSISNAENKDDSDSEVEDITKPKKSDYSSKYAIERINDLKDFFLNKKEDFSNVVDFLFNTENIVLEKCKTKQSSITDFVKKA